MRSAREQSVQQDVDLESGQEKEPGNEYCVRGARGANLVIMIQVNTSRRK